MPLAQLPLTGRPHRNQQLFSDHYLDAVLPALPEWKLRAGDAQHLLEKIRRIYSDFVPGNNEAQTEQGFIRPVLQALTGCAPLAIRAVRAALDVGIAASA